MATTCFICPEINIGFLDKSRENIKPQVYPLFFGTSIQKGTYDEKEEQRSKWPNKER
jgi:hypothetical protein